MNKNLSRRDFLKLAGVTSAGLALSACGVKATEFPTATFVPPTETTIPPTETTIPTLTFTPVPPTATSTPIPPIETLSVSQESVNQFASAVQKAGINISAESILQQGFQIQTIINKEGKPFDIAFVKLDPDPSAQGETLEGNYPLMIKSDEGEWEHTTFRNIGNIVGVSIGTSVNGADDWHNKLYQERASEFQTITPIGYTVEDVLNRLSEPTYGNFIKDLHKKGVKVRMYNLFWHADHNLNGQPNMDDPLWQGAPPKGSPASDEYKIMVGNQMDVDIRNLLKQAPYITEIGFANEALTGHGLWEDSPYYRAFGKDWLVEAYVRTFEIASKEFGRIPGKDLTLFYSDYNFGFPTVKSDIVFNELQRTKSNIIQRLTADGFTPLDNPFVVDEQGHINLSEPQVDVELHVSQLNEEAFQANLKRFNQIGSVWLGEITVRGGSRQERTDIVKMMMRAGINAGVRNFLFWELMSVKNGYYAKGDLLFDPKDSYKNTSTTYELFKFLIENIKE